MANGVTSPNGANGMKKPTVHTHAGTGLKYIKGAKQVLFETGIIISREEFDKLENGGLAERLEELSQDPQNINFDFAYGCSTGVLRKRKGTADLVANARTERRRAKEADLLKRQQCTGDVFEFMLHGVPAPSKTVLEQKKDTGEPLAFSSVSLVVVVMVIVGIGSAIMSAYHTSTFLIQGGKPIWTGIMTGIMFILFSGTAFTAARYFLQEKGLQKIFGFLFLIAGFTIIAYSMLSTLTVNYDSFKWVDDEKISVSVENDETLQSHIELLNLNREELEEVNNRIARLNEEAEYWRTMSWRRYDEFQEQILQAQELRSELRQRQIELEATRPELVTYAAASRETVYTMMARLLKIPEDVARFFVYVAPACLYDILAPFALSIVLLLTDRRKRKEGEVK